MENERYTEKRPSKKRREEKKRRKKIRMWVMLALLVILAGATAFGLSPYFDVDKIRAEGNTYYTQEEIIQASGLKTGGNIFKKNTGDAEEKLLSDPYFSDVDVKRDLPNTLVIEVRERKECATVPYGEEYVVIDREGVVLAKEDRQPELTLIDGMTIKSMTPGEPLEVKEKEVFGRTMELLDLTEKEDLYFYEVHLKKNTIVANIYEDLSCKGSAEDVIKNIENGNLQEVIYDLYKKKVTKGTIIVSGTKYCSFSPEIQ